jgi:hypothetical protein
LSENHKPDDELLIQALTHAWNWFALHGKQRMQIVNFFLITTAFLSAAFASSILSTPIVASAVGLVGFISSVTFSRIESRTRDLIKIGEHALTTLEGQLAQRIELPALKLVERAEATPRRFGTYAKTIALLHRMTACGFLAGSIYALGRAIHHA